MAMEPGSGVRRVAVAQIGLGAVGATVIRRVLLQRDVLATRGLRLEYVALATRRGLTTRREGWTDQSLVTAALGRQTGEWRPESLMNPLDLRDCLDAVAGGGFDGAMVVDCGVGADTGPAVLAALQAGWRAVFANKAPLAGSLANWRELLVASDGGRRLWREATVGAGLPLFATLRLLAESGDRVERIEATLSGTLGYVLGCMERGDTLRSAVRRAINLGYTEPDPREDLAALDVGRKLVILARGLGWEIEPEQALATPLVPWADSLDVALDAAEATVENEVRLMLADGAAPRYLGVVSRDRVEARLRATDRSGPFSLAGGPTAVFALTTRDYGEAPLVLAGPGAGPIVTAAGVYADMLRAARGDE